jgi:hypothetical protein
MDVRKIIAELVAERDRLDAAILALERLKRTHTEARERRLARKGPAAEDDGNSAILGASATSG